MTEEIELKPCPFCGCADNQLGTEYEEAEEYNIYCGDCFAEAPMRGSEDDAMKAWNKRAVLEAPPWVDEDALKEFCKLNGALQVWRSWRDTMIAQGREVKAEYMELETLPQRDIELDAQIAFDVISDFLFYIKTHPHPLPPAPEQP